MAETLEFRVFICTFTGDRANLKGTAVNPVNWFPHFSQLRSLKVFPMIYLDRKPTFSSTKQLKQGYYLIVLHFCFSFYSLT